MSAADTVQPGRRSSAAVRSTGRFLRDASVGALRDFVWADLRNGMLSLHGLSFTTRVLVIFGFGLLIALTLSLLFADAWRSQFSLIPLTRGLPGRGTMLPSAVVPATLFIMALSWTFWLGGALHSAPWIRIGALTMFLIIAVGWVLGTSFADDRAEQVSQAMLLAIPLLFVARWRGRIRPALEFGLLFVCVCTMFALVQQQGLQSWAASNEPVMLVKLNVDVLSLRSLIHPMLVLAGMGVAGFALQLGGWSATLISDRAPRSIVVLLVAAIGWLIYTAGIQLIDLAGGDSDGAWIGSYAGALVSVGLVVLSWLVVNRRRRADGDPQPTADEVVDAAGSQAMKLIVIYFALPLIMVLATGVLWALFVLRLVPSIPVAVGFLFALLSDDTTQQAWTIAVSLVLCLLGLWLATRGQRAPAVYLLVVGVLTIWGRLSASSGPFPWFSRSAAPTAIDVWWLAILVILTATLAIRRRLTQSRATVLFTFALALILLQYTDFLSNRFSPVFGSAGVAFLAFGVLWDTLTVGSWANSGSPSLPRESRIFLYLGYALLSIAVVNWALTVHDLSTVNQLTGEATLGGFERFGKPMLYAAFAAMLAPLVAWHPETASAKTADESPQ